MNHNKINYIYVKKLHYSYIYNFIYKTSSSHKLISKQLNTISLYFDYKSCHNNKITPKSYKFKRKKT